VKPGDKLLVAVKGIPQSTLGFGRLCPRARALVAIGNQFALQGLSRSYNFVGFFEKYGFQTRVAYSHRGAFLAALSQPDQSNEPIYTAAYGQLDMSASYDFNKHFSVLFDAINLTSASTHQYARYKEQFISASEGFARYQVGFRVVL